ncbi:hypothetical protein [Pantoea brenneri]|jgi:hypothetical protein|uniref:hypothetical protein n=1 Tax=Pantoea brenneri TaxID=472694 RepID=UPI002449119F|nr:hypothetical protein [Pantoea brenneri]MDH1089262.1 hypothetical protein [Pantoea brenneri]
MPLPERMKPASVSRKKIAQLASQAQQILAKIDAGTDPQESELTMMIADWNAQVTHPYGYSDFRDFSSSMDASDFTRIAINPIKFYADFSWDELVQTINFICNAEGKDAEQHFAISLLEKNFDANPSDLIYWPDEWFRNPDMMAIDLSPEQIGGYLMARSGRHLADAPEIELIYPLPDSETD